MTSTTSERPHRSASQLGLWDRCQIAYGFRYDEGRRGAKSTPAIRGICVHDASAHNLRQKVKTRRDLPLDEVLDYTAEAVDLQFADRVHFSAHQRTVGVKKVKAAVQRQSIEMVRAFHLRQAPHTKPLYVERLVRLRTDRRRLAFDLMVRIDHATRDHSVADIKTSGRPLPPGDEHINRQLTLYHPAHKAITGRYPRRVGLIGIHQVGAQPARMQRRWSTRNEHDVRSIITTLKQMDTAVRSGVRVPTDPGSWWCSERWCDYWAICPFVRGIRERRRT